MSYNACVGCMWKKWAVLRVSHNYLPMRIFSVIYTFLKQRNCVVSKGETKSAPFVFTFHLFGYCPLLVARGLTSASWPHVWILCDIVSFRPWLIPTLCRCLLGIAYRPEGNDRMTQCRNDTMSEWDKIEMTQWRNANKDQPTPRQ